MAEAEHPPGFFLYCRDLVSDGKVEVMDTAEFGAYILLLCKAWFEKPVATIPDDDEVLARWARMPPKQWAKHKDRVLAPWKRRDGRWVQKRLEQEYKGMMDNRERKKAAGQKGANSRWQKDATALQSHDSAIDLPLAKNGLSSATASASPPASASAKEQVGRSVEDSWEGVQGEDEKPASRTVLDALENFSTRNLKSTASLCILHRRLNTERPNLFDGSEEMLLNIIGAAVRSFSLELSKSKPALDFFQGIISKQVWRFINADERREAAERLRSHRSNLRTKKAGRVEFDPETIPLCDELEAVQ